MKPYWLPLLLYSMMLHAAPEGFECKAGDASHTRAGADGLVQSSGRAVVHWDSFSLASGESIRFEQSGAHPAILNRVVGELPSHIHGAIHSNGTVWLINSNGIVIGSEGRINAANFLASTLDLLDGEFLSGNEFVFGGTRGRIEQNGVIECPDGYVMLMSPEHIDQTGTIRAAKVGLGVGEEILFIPKQSPLMAIRLSSMEETENRYAKAIQHKGLIEAKGIEERGGEVYLVAENLCEVTGEIVAPGGVVHILGEEVVHMDKARVDVSGKHGGGTLLVGGDYQGKNPEIRNAKRNWMGPEVEIYADALESGNGGKVIFWADEVTCAYGNVSARGGELSGDGGFVEISAERLDFRAFTDRRAPHGKAGTLLLDPWNVTVTSAANANVTFGAPNYTIDNTAANIQASDIATNLGTGSVNINTSRTTNSPNEQGIIDIQASAGATITWSGDFTLTLEADTSIIVASGVTIARTGTGTTDAMYFVANGWQSGHSTGSTSGIDITGALTADTGEIFLLGVGGSTGGTGVILNSGASIDAPTITIMGTGGNSVASQRGFTMVAGSALGGSNTDTITVTGFGGGTQAGGAANSNHGILIQGGTIETDSGTVTLNGTGGGSGTGAANQGIYFVTAAAAYTNIGTLTLSGHGGSGSGGGHRGVLIDAAMDLGSAALILQDCVGGTGGSSNYGISIEATVTTTESMLFDNIAGGGDGTGTSHHGLYITTDGILRAPTITAQDITGGNGTSSCYGFFMDGTAILGSDGTAGTPATTSISITAVGGMGAAATSDNAGIRINPGTIVADGANGGTFTFNGTGGGNSTTGTNANIGIRLIGVTFTNANTINFTGVGGVGTTTSNSGVVIGGNVTFTGITPTNTNFLNCFGGMGTGDSHGVTLDGGFSFSISTGTILFSNIKGGSTDTGNTGVRIAGILAAPTIIAADVVGGDGTSTNHGFYLNGGTLGSSAAPATTLINITATGGGTLSAGTNDNYGINLSTGTIQGAAGGAVVTLNGTGGGNTTSGTINNYGVRIASITVDNATTLNLTGVGGKGATVDHRGVVIAGTPSFTGVTPTTIHFLNCVGGTGTTGNHGVSIGVNLTSPTGTIQFTNCSGGTGTTDNYGMLLTGTLAAPTIIATDLSGGNGTANNYGFLLNAGTLGSATTSSIAITGYGSGTSTGSSNMGVVIIGGTIRVSAGNSVSLTGIGGGTSAGAGGTNYGVHFTSTATTYTDVRILTISGQGGKGSGGSHRGVRVDRAIDLSGDASSSLRFQNCFGGEGGTLNIGLDVVAVATAGLNILCNNVAGGGPGGSSNRGINIGSGGQLAAPTIIGTDISGGSGTLDNVGFLLSSGGTLGSTTTTSVSITATGGSSLIATSSNYGIELRGTVLGASAGTPTFTFNGTGGSGTNDEDGILIGTVAMNNVHTINFTGRGGNGSSGGSRGVRIPISTTPSFGGTITPTAVNFINCTGGTGSSTNYGIEVASNFIVPTGTLLFSNVSGGNGTTSNYGIRIAAALAAPTITGVDISGGNGTSGGIAFYLASGGILGSAATPATTSVNITATGGSGPAATSSNYGVYVEAGTIRGTAGGTAVFTFNGTGGGNSTTGTTTNNGIRMAGITIDNVATLNLTGVGGRGTSDQTGVAILGAPSFTGITPTTINFTNCRGGTGTTGNYGIDVGANFISPTGTILFSNVSGGNGTTNNIGIRIGATLAAPTITGVDISGGNGTNASFGFYLASGTLGSAATPATTSVNITATGNSGPAATSTNYGIYLEAGTLQGISGGTAIFTFNGTGGGDVITGTSANYGIRINAIAINDVTTLNLTGIGGRGNTSGDCTGVSIQGAPTFGGTTTPSFIRFINCAGGANPGGINFGVDVQANLTLPTAGGTILFSNVAGGTNPLAVNNGATNAGVRITATGTLAAATIIGTDINGGANGTNTNYGFFLNNGILGSAADPATTLIDITAAGGGTLTGGTSSNFGVHIDRGTIQGATAGAAIRFNGTGGGNTTSGTANNYGIRFSGATAANNITTLEMTGVGGKGTSSSNIGVSIEGVATFGGAVTPTTVTFLNCVGGTGTTGNIGVNIASNFISPTGTIRFLNCTGGTGTSGQTGISLTAILAAPTIFGTDISGGLGTTQCYGFFTTGTLGSATTTSVDITAKGGGDPVSAGNQNYGINLSGGTLLGAGAGTTFTFNGTGGGHSATGTTDNAGIRIAAIAINDIETLNLTGVGGRGTNSQEGVVVEGIPTFGGTTTPSAINFINCSGGTGSGTTNIGVDIAANLILPTAGGTIRFTNVSGGTGTASNYGVLIGTSRTLAAENIIGTNISGGIGTSDNFGFYLSSATSVLGSAANPATASVDIEATGGGTVSGGTARNYGINLNLGTIRGASVTGGTFTFNGTGGGHPTTGQLSNYGIRIGTITIDNVTTLNLTGVGGKGNGSSQSGVAIQGAPIPSGVATTAINFTNCFGGTGTIDNRGVTIEASFAFPTAAITFTNIAGGTGTTGTGNQGLHVSSTLSGASISGTNILGGIGTNTNHGLFLNGGTLTSAGAINLSATGGRTGSGNAGVFLGTGTINATGSVTFNGVGGPLATGGTSPGISVRGVTFGSGVTAISLIGTGGGTSGGAGASNHGVVFETAAATYPASLTTLTVQGMGGGGSGGSHFGVSIAQAMALGAANATFKDCLGGDGGSNDYGVSIGANVTTTGEIEFSNVIGGGSGSGTDHYGINHSAGQLSATTITCANIIGGEGTGVAAHCVGYFLSGTGTFGSATTSALTLSASGGGTATGGTNSTNHGIEIAGGTIQTNNNTVMLNGIGGGGNGSGATNYGVRVSGAATYTTITEFTFSGTGGTGSGGQHRGVSIEAAVSLGAADCTFRNITGGVGGDSNDGIHLAGAVATTGAILFDNVSGGGGGSGSSHVGLFVTTNGLLDAPTITGVNITGGFGANSCYGINLSAGAIGSANSTNIQLTATGGGTTATNYGIRLGAGSIVTDVGGTVILTGYGSSLATGNGNPGISVRNVTFGDDIDTLTLTGTGGGNSSSTGTDNHGIVFETSAATYPANLTLLTLTGTGGTGSGGTHNGVRVTQALALNDADLLVQNSVGGTLGSSSATSNAGVFIGANISTTGSCTFSNCVGGSGGTDNYGIHCSSGTLNAASIVATGIKGGNGINSNYGFYLNGGTLGSSLTTTSVDITAAGGGTLTGGTTGNDGIILSSGTIQGISGSGASLTFNGTGGGNTTTGTSDNAGIRMSSITIDNIATLNLTGVGGKGTAGNNVGVGVQGAPNFTGITPSAINFTNCVGGAGGGNDDAGVTFSASFISPTGTILFSNIAGGSSSGARNIGVRINSSGTCAAPIILGVDITGGSGTNTNYGFWLNGGTLGSASTTTSVDIRATGGGTLTGGTGSNYGVYFNSGTIQGSAGGNTTFTFNGTGGGNTTTGTNANSGIRIEGIAINNVTTLNLTGVGGKGTTTDQRGVIVQGVPTFGGTFTPTTVNFTNCFGGIGTTGNHGVSIGANFICPTGTIRFTNVTGGSGSDTNHGLLITATLAAPTILGADITGGSGSTNNFGFFLSGGILGSAATPATTSVNMTAVGGDLPSGSTNSNYGINLSSGTIQGDSGSGATFTFNGTGGGNTATGTTNNYGINIGAITTNNVATLNLTGTGGRGTTGQTGVITTGVASFTGITPTQINFANCTGGAGTTDNIGVNILANFTSPTGTIRFSNVSGGTGSGGGNIGVRVSAPLAAPVILGTDINGGNGTGGDNGFHILNTLGSASTTTLVDIQATGGWGIVENNVGIFIFNGTLQGNSSTGATFTLNGTGGGNTSAGRFNYGIRVLTSSVNNVTTLNLTGVGGKGTANERGVTIEGVATFGGTIPTTAINFTNCSGGIGTQSDHYGVHIGSNFICPTAAIQFTNISGGTGTANNYGLFVLATLSGASIQGTNILGGSGTNTNHGLFLAGGTLTSAGAINLSATGGGTGSSDVGVMLSTGTINATSSVTFNGIGGPLSTGGTSPGISLRGVTFGDDILAISLIGTGGGTSASAGASNHGVVFETAAATYPADLGTLTVQGIGGAGTGGGHRGVLVSQDIVLAAADIAFQNSIGSTGAAGVEIAADVTSAGGLTFANCTGGNSGSNNHGVYLPAGGAIDVADVFGSGLSGGAGNATNIGFYLDGGTCTVDTTIEIAANSFGTGANNHAVWLESGTLTAPTSVELTGSASLFATGSGSTGIVFDAATVVTPTLTLTGTGGSGTGSTRGIDIGAGGAPSLTVADFTLTGHGGSGTNTDGLRISTNPITASGTISFTGCTGGASGRGVVITSAVTAADIAMTNCSGGAGPSNNNGVEIGVSGLLDADTIMGTALAGGIGTSGSGFAMTGGAIDAETVNIAGLSNGTDSTHCGILLAIGNIDANTVTFHGTGSFLASGSNNTGILSSGFSNFTATTIALTGFGGSGTSSCRGIAWEAGSLGNMAAASCALVGMGGGTTTSNSGVHLLGGSIDLMSAPLTVTGTGGGTTGSGNYGIAMTDTDYTGVSAFTFTGNGGTGTNEQHGVVVNSSSALTLTAPATFLSCKGGIGGINNAAVAFEQDFTATTLAFTNCSGGSGTSDNYGIWIEPNLTLAAATLTATGITSGTGGSGNYGFYLNDAALNVTGNLSIQSATIAGSNGSGIRFDTGSVATVGGTVTFMGSGSTTTSTNSHGIWLAGAGTALNSTGNVALIGTAGLGTGSHAVFLETQAAVSAVGASTIALSGNDIALGLSTLTTASGDITCNSPVLLIANPTLASTSGDITFNDTVNGGFNLTVSGTSGLLHFVRAVGNTAPLANLTITAANLRIDDNVTLTGANTLTVPSVTTIGGASTIANTPAAITWNGTIDRVGTVGRLTLQTTNTITLGADIGSTLPLTDFTATGPTVLGNSIGVIATEAIVFSNTINATTDSVQSLTLDAGALGNISLISPVGSTNRLGFLAIDNAYDVSTDSVSAVFISQVLGSGTSTFGALDTTAAGGLLGIILTGNRFQFSGLVNTANNGPVTVTNSGIATINANIFTAAGSITFSGPVAVTGARTLDTNDSINDLDDIEFMEAVNGPGSLTLVAEDVIFHSSAGGSTPLASIETTATTASLGGDQTATGAITYHCPVTTTTLAAIQGSTLTFDSAITTSGNSLTLLSTNDTAIAGTITTTGGDLDIQSTSGSISVAAINTSAIGTIGGHILLQPSRSLIPGVLGNIPVGTITLNGNLNATGSTNGWISLAPEARNGYPSVATIFSPHGIPITIAGGTLTIGKNEAMTILSNCSLNVDTIASLGDLVVLGDLTINGTNPLTPAPALISYKRGSIAILDSSGILISSDAEHFVYQSTLTFDVDLASANLLAEPTLTLADLQFPPYTLNFDQGSPIPPVPPIPILPANVRENAIDLLLIALSEMGDRLPLFQPKPFSASICLKDKEGETCFYVEPRFVSFLPENQVK